MRHPCRTVCLVAVTVVCLTGCSVRYPFQLLLTVQNADSGDPIENVMGTLDTYGVEERKAELNFGSPLAHSTDVNGRLRYDFSISHRVDATPHWYLKLQKEGFEPLIVDVRPKPSEPSKDVTPLPVTVQMKPITKKL